MKDLDDKPAGPAAGDFLSRWSQRKTESRLKAPPKPETLETQPSEPKVPEPETEPGAVDPASLPPIDSLTAGSDFSAFLKAGVPAELRAAALRKLWLIEPSVLQPDRLVEYGWEFNTPDYGGLLANERIAELKRHVFEGSPRAEPAEVSKEALDDPAAPVEQDGRLAQIAVSESEAPLSEAPLSVEGANSEKADPAQNPTPRRRHGGALPR